MSMAENLRATGIDVELKSSVVIIYLTCNITPKLLEMERILQLIDEKQNLTDLKASIESLKTEVISTLNYNFDLWKEQSMAAVKSGELR